MSTAAKITGVEIKKKTREIEKEAGEEHFQVCLLSISIILLLFALLCLLLGII